MRGERLPGQGEGALGPLSAISVLLPWVLGQVTLAAVVGGLAALAQHAGHIQLRAAGVDGLVRDFPLTPHVLVMVAVGTLAVAGTTGLLRAGARVSAGLPLIAAAAGPMAIVAAPARASLVSMQTGNTARWWHLAVGALVLAVLVTWTVVVVHRAPGSPLDMVSRLSPGFLLLVLTAVAALAVVALAPEPEPTAPTAVPVAAWSVLAATVAVVVVTERRGAAAAAMAALTLAAVLGFPLAYRHESAGAAVPGWEVTGTSPVVLSTMLGSVVLIALVVSCLLRVAITVLAARGRRPFMSLRMPARRVPT